jgi:hypothetical protein
VSPGEGRDKIGFAIKRPPPPPPPPPDVVADQKDKKASCAHSGWLTTNFNTCPENTNDGVIHRYA